MKTLAELQNECFALGIRVETNGRPSKEPYIAALRDFHWRKDHPNEPLPAQVMPMLLGSWEDLDEAEAEEIEHDCHLWIVQPKLDGVRALLHIEQDRVRITSRTVSEVTYRLSEFQANVPHLTEGLSQLTGTILDGELVCPASTLDTGNTTAETSLQATMAILATSPDNARRMQDEQNARIRFHAFDVLRFRGIDTTSLPLIDRLEYLAAAIRRADNPFIELVQSYMVAKGNVHRSILGAGGEGTVWKRFDQAYEPGRRVKHWLKRKRGIEVEAFVTDCKAGNNGHTGLVGAIEFSSRQDGRTIPVAWVSSFRDAERTAMTQIDTNGKPHLAPSFVGKRAVISGHALSARSNRLRHARLVRWIEEASGIPAST